MAKNGIDLDLTGFQKDLLQGLISQGLSKAETSKGGRKINLEFADPVAGTRLTAQQVKAHDEAMAAYSPLVKSVLNVLNGPGDSIERLAFEVQPSMQNQFQGLWKMKMRLLPDDILKRIAIQDSLIAAIANTRSSQVAAFGRPQPDRFSTGIRIEPEPHYTEKLDPKKKEEIQKRISEVEALLMTCGETSGWDDQDALNLSQFLFQSARNAVIVGRIATEMIWIDKDGQRKFHSFRPIDAGTIYKAAPQKEAAESVRRNALHLIESLKNKKLEPERFQNDSYSWVQVVDGRPQQAFGPDECVCHNFYPVPDVELDGYPVTPIDTIIADVTMHINIVTHNKLYFESGRASRGMIVIQSEDVDENVVGFVRQQFNASINSVGKSWRMPIFGIGPKDQINWVPIDNSSRDMEFQYLSDTNSRVILSAFQMSPEELPGYAHLSRGTNNQALSECFSPESLVWTDRGVVSATDLLSGRPEVSTRVWTGTDFVVARLFTTGEKTLCETRAGGNVLKTSPDHRFKVLSVDGELVWRRQEELVVGDLLAMNAKPVEGDPGSVPVYNDKKLTVEMMEVLGWSVGDGTLTPPVLNSRGGTLKLFYHQDKERDVWEKHNQVLSDFGLNVKHHERTVSEQEAEGIKERYGFKSVAATRLTNVVHSNDFVGFLRELGFNFSSEGKVVPPTFHVLPVEYRQAFLRGFFSADGHATKQGHVILTVQDDRTREQVRQMLLGLGIRTLPCGGVVRESFGEMALEKQLFIKDKEAFWQQIGFVQPHKIARRRDQKWSIGSVPAPLASKLLVPVLDSEVYRSWDKKTRDNLRSVAQTGCPGIKTSRSISWGSLRNVLVATLGAAPSWMSDYHLEPVTELLNSGLVVPMVDVEVFDSHHAQALQGFIVHNSNNEFKLEAHRDVGIRPLLAQFQNFLNAKILPLLAPDLAEFCSIKFVGLDVDTAEKESTRIMQDAAVHMSQDEIMEKVEKHPIGKRWGGQFLLSPQWQSIVDKYLLVGDVLEHFFGIEGASKDPRFQYVNNNLWMQWQQMQQEAQQMQMQAQQQQAQAQQPQLGQDGQDQNAQQQEPTDLTRSIDQLSGLLTKSETQLPWSKRTLIAHQRKLVEKVIQGFESDSEDATKEIVKIAQEHLPSSLKE